MRILEVDSSISIATIILAFATIAFGLISFIGGIRFMSDDEFPEGLIIFFMGIMLVSGGISIFNDDMKQTDQIKAIISGTMTVEELETQYDIISYNNGIWTLKEREEEGEVK